MPELTEEQTKQLLNDILKNSIPHSLNVTKQTEENAIKECDEYIKTGNKLINDMSPLSVYYIISKLPETKQIKFIKENIKYIKTHENDIFLYTMLSPKSLSYFLSFNVLKELKNIDKEIFKKVISQTQENLFNGFTNKDYYGFYIDFYNELIEIDNKSFINGLYFHNRCCYDDKNIQDINEKFKLQKEYNKEFMSFIIEKYKDKIDSFKPRELLSFIRCIEDTEQYKYFINKYYDKLNTSLNVIEEYYLNDYLRDIDGIKQEILIINFFENIIKKRDIHKIIYNITPNAIIYLYNKHKEIFKTLSLKEWVKICAKQRVFNDSFRAILDTYETTNIEELYDTPFYISYWNRKSISALMYVETKYRNNIKTNGLLSEIDNNTCIFSETYLLNLCELKERFKKKTITKHDKSYQQHLSNFTIFLKNQNIINSIENNNFKEIEKLFYRIVMGKSISIVYKLSNIEEITIINRLGEIGFNVDEFSVEQLENYNVKQHKQIYKRFEDNKFLIKYYKKLTLKLIFMIGFNNTKSLLEIDDTLPVLEHLVGNVDVKNITLDNQGNPILNTKLINLLFSDKNKIKEMLLNKDNDLYKYFPRIFSEWEMIKINDKDKSLKTVIDYLKSDEISLPPKYYRLEGLFKFIGCKNTIVNETLSLHNQMLYRTSSSIPRIKGHKEEYSYEVLRFDDMEALSIGNKTDCCFTVLGNGYECLKHALTSQNGRVFIIRKDNEIIAHSWIWRNGDLLCFDNIEISKKINSVDFLDVYLQASDDLIKTSYEYEGIDNCIKNITIGFTNFDKEIKGIEKYPCLISKNCNLENKDFGSKLGNKRKFVDILPQPIEEVGYSDSKNVQYIIRGNEEFSLKEIHCLYQDERYDIMHYTSNIEYDKEYIKKINKIINALIYSKREKDDTLNQFKLIDIEDLTEVYCNNDWYIITFPNGSVEKYIASSDKRALEEFNSTIANQVKKLKRKKD